MYVRSMWSNSVTQGKNYAIDSLPLRQLIRLTTTEVFKSKTEND